MEPETKISWAGSTEPADPSGVAYFEYTDAEGGTRSFSLRLPDFGAYINLLGWANSVARSSLHRASRQIRSIADQIYTEANYW